MYPLKFQPFVGKSYDNNAFGKRILVLGDSHYGSEPSPNITRDVINRYLYANAEHEGWMNTFTKFERSLVNKETNRQDSQMIWNSLMFYNYLQVLLDGPRAAGTPEEYAQSAGAFFEVLEKYKPQILIVWGKRLWNMLPESNWEDGEDISVDGYSVDNGYYKLSDGHLVKAFCIYHPSAGYSWDYWFKVISKFLSFDSTEVQGIDYINFSNFRKFRSFPTLNLGGVTCLVGANNAGKSTFSKGALIFIDFLKRWHNGGLVIDFASDLCRSLKITSYRDALCYKASEGDDILFYAGIGRYQYEAAFAPTEHPICDSTSKVSARYVKVTDTMDNNAEYTLRYDSSVNNVHAEAMLPVFAPSDEALIVMERFINSPICSCSLTEKEKALNLIGDIRDHIVNNDYTTTTVVEAFNEVEVLLGEEVPNECRDTFAALKDAINQVVEERERISVKFTLSRNSTVKDFIAKLKIINQLQQNYDESIRNNVAVRELAFCPIISLNGAKTFNVRDTDSVSRAVCTYGQIMRSLDNKFLDFIKKWINDGNGFGIGDEIHVNNVEGLNEVFTLKVKKYDDHEVALTSLGTGSVHIITLILSLVNIIAQHGALSKLVIFVEEPEINLHPNFQSKLADFFLDLYKTFGMQVVVETHSEYLVRKMQVLVAKSVYEGRKYIDECNKTVKLYYFTPEDNGFPYVLEFMSTGHLSRQFGEGFFDEAGKSYNELIMMERGLK